MRARKAGSVPEGRAFVCGSAPGSRVVDVVGGTVVDVVDVVVVVVVDIARRVAASGRADEHAASRSTATTEARFT